MSKIKELDNWRHNLCSWIGRFNVTQDVSTTQFDLKIQYNPDQNLVTLWKLTNQLQSLYEEAKDLKSPTQYWRTNLEG